MEKYVLALIDWSSNLFGSISEFHERQDLINTFQNGDITQMMILLTFIVAYSIAIHIAISGIVGKYIFTELNHSVF